MGRRTAREGADMKTKTIAENPPEDADGLYDAYIEAGRKL